MCSQKEKFYKKILALNTYRLLTHKIFPVPIQVYKKCLCKSKCFANKFKCKSGITIPFYLFIFLFIR